MIQAIPARNTRPSQEAPSLTSTGYLMHLALNHLSDGVREVISGSGLHAGQLAILGALADKGEMSQRQLGAVARIEKSSLVNFLDQLEEGHWIKRIPNPNDRRSYCIRLTPRGAEKYRKLGPSLKKVQDQFLAPLNAKEQTQLQDFLQRLAEGA